MKTTAVARGGPASAKRRAKKPAISGGWIAGLFLLAVVGGLTWLVLSSPSGRHAPTASSTPDPTAALDRSLAATTGGMVDLKSYQGSKVVLYFYEGAG